MTTPTTTDNSIPLRPLLLSIMRAAPERRWSYPALYHQLRTQVPDANTKDVQNALTWQFKRGNVNYEYDHDIEIDVWHLTTRGHNA